MYIDILNKSCPNLWLDYSTLCTWNTLKISWTDCVLDWGKTFEFMLHLIPINPPT